MNAAATRRELKRYKAVVNAGRMERKKSPESFTPWSAVKESSIP